MNHGESHDPSSLIYSRTVWKRFGDTAEHACISIPKCASGVRERLESFPGRRGGNSDSSEDCEVQMLNKIRVRSSAGILDGLVKLE